MKKEEELILHNFLIDFKFGSICLWIINILQVCCALLEIALTDLNIKMLPEFYQLSSINLGIGSGIIIGRLFAGLILAYRFEMKK